MDGSSFVSKFGSARTTGRIFVYESAPAVCKILGLYNFSIGIAACDHIGSNVTPPKVHERACAHDLPPTMVMHLV